MLCLFDDPVLFRSATRRACGRRPPAATCSATRKRWCGRLVAGWVSTCCDRHPASASTSACLPVNRSLSELCKNYVRSARKSPARVRASRGRARRRAAGVRVKRVGGNRSAAQGYNRKHSVFLRRARPPQQQGTEQTREQLSFTARGGGWHSRCAHPGGICGGLWVGLC